MDDIAKLNRDGWDRLVDEDNIWTRPVPSQVIERARRGDWAIVLTPNKPVPHDWFGAITDGNLTGRDILCLASGGGQQGPVLSAAGARVTMFDASAKQLAQDEMVARRDGLALVTRQGLMHDLGCFEDESFDVIFHPVSNCFAPEIETVWRECFRVLRKGGALLAGFMNPAVYVFDLAAQERGEMVVRFTLPYADTVDLPPEELRRLVERDAVVEFSHSLETQIGGQLQAGFVLTHLFEDKDRASEDAIRSRHMPTMLATRAVKP